MRPYSARIANQPTTFEDVMGSAQRKNSRARRRAGRTKAKIKTRRSTTKALSSTTEPVKKQPIKPRQRGYAAASIGSSAHRRKPILNGRDGRSSSVKTQTDITALPPATAANENRDLRPASAGPTQIIAFWSPVAMVLRQQALLTSMLLSITHSHQLWARAFSSR